MRFFRRWSIPAATLALLAGAALRIAFVRHAPPLTGDATVYGQIATNWMRSNFYGYSPGGHPHLTLIRLPGYPLFLMLCFRLFGVGNYLAVMAVQCLVDLGTCVLVGLTARRLFGPRAGLLALTLAALCPFTANYVAAPLTETLTLFSVALATYALTRWLAHPGLTRWLAALAFALAYTLLLRPEQALLTVAFLPVLWWRSGPVGWRPAPHAVLPKLRPAALAALAAVLPLVPWTARNWHTFHVVEPLAPHYATDPGEYIPLGFQRWYRSWAIDFASTEDVYWNFDGAQINMGDLPNRAFDSPAQRAQTAALLADYNQTTDSNPTIDACFEQIARQRISASPARYYLWLPFARLANMLLRPRTELMQTTLDWWNRREYPHDFRFAFSYAALNFAYLALGVAGLVRWARHTTRLHPVLLATAAFVLMRCALLLTLDNSEPRYTLELFPILCLWAAALAAPARSTAGRSSSSYPS